MKMRDYLKRNYLLAGPQKSTPDRYRYLVENFQSLYGQGDVCLARAPGRINLIGEHTDYNGCPVLPLAINRDILAVFRPDSGGRIEIKSLEERSEPRSYSIQEQIPPYPAGDWGNYPKAAVQGLVGHLHEQKKIQNSFTGFRALITGDIPPAAGMSSSSALVVLAALMFLEANDLIMPYPVLSQLLAEAERYVGTQGGGMDQTISLMGKAGCALKIDFNPFGTESIVLPEGFVFVVSNSMITAGKTHEAMAKYNRRAIECRLAVAVLRSLLSRYLPPGFPFELIGDLTEERTGLSRKEIGDLAGRFLKDQPYSVAEIASETGITSEDVGERFCRDRGGGVFPEPEEGYKLKMRFRHIFTEWQRVDESVRAFRDGDMYLFGEYMNLSHASCRDDYEISCPELDILTELAGFHGALGSRLTGAGFGGCSISLVGESSAEIFIEKMKQDYYRDYLHWEIKERDDVIFPCKAVDGAGSLTSLLVVAGPLDGENPFSVE